MGKEWFKSETEVKCGLHMVKKHSEKKAMLFEGIVSRMSGILSVELLSEDADQVVLKTNEGKMTRSNITRIESDDKLTFEYDEEYVAGKATTVNSHYKHVFISSDTGVRHILTISNVKASGILGFFYRLFGSKNIGKDVMKAVESFFLAHDRFPKQ